MFLCTPHSIRIQVVSLYHDPEGVNVFTRSTPTSNSPHDATDAGKKLSESSCTVESLQSKVKELQLALSKYEPEMAGSSKLYEKRPSIVTFCEIEQNKHHSSNNGVDTATGQED